VTRRQSFLFIAHFRVKQCSNSFEIYRVSLCEEKKDNFQFWGKSGKNCAHGARKKFLFIGSFPDSNLQKNHPIHLKFLGCIYVL
jgi:hypothetical protein